VHGRRSGAGSTSHLAGRPLDLTCRNAEGTISKENRPPTSNSSRLERIEPADYGTMNPAAQADFRFKSARNRAHIPAIPTPEAINPHQLCAIGTRGVNTPRSCGPVACILTRPTARRNFGAALRLTLEEPGGRRPTTIKPRCGRTNR